MNSYFYVDVDIKKDVIFCVLGNYEAENSSCIIKDIFETQRGKCNNQLENSSKSFAYQMSSNVSIAHLPRSQMMCFVAEAKINNSTSTMILVGNFSTPIGSTCYIR